MTHLSYPLSENIAICYNLNITDSNMLCQGQTRILAQAGKKCFLFKHPATKSITTDAKSVRFWLFQQKSCTLSGKTLFYGSPEDLAITVSARTLRHWKEATIPSATNVSVTSDSNAMHVRVTSDPNVTHVYFSVAGNSTVMHLPIIPVSSIFPAQRPVETFAEAEPEAGQDKRKEQRYG